MSSPTNPQPKRIPVIWRIVLVLAGLALVAFVAIQFIPVNRTNPPETTPIQWDSPQTAALAKVACMDCHSNETIWPWYSYVAPASWLVYYDVLAGRDRLNWSIGGGGEGFRNRASHSGDLAYQLGGIIAGESGRGEGGFGGEGGEGGEGRERTFNGAPRATPQGGFGEGEGGFGGGGEFARVIQNGSMPPTKYTILHPAAVLTDAQKQQLIQGLNATFGGR